MVKWEWCCVFLPPPGPIALLGKQIVTSFGSKGNSKIAGSQLWAWTSDQTKVQHVFSLCPVISANYNLPPPFPLSPLPLFLVLSSSSSIHKPSLSLLTFLSLSPRLCGRRGKVTDSTLGRLQCADLLQVQGIICCFGKEEWVVGVGGYVDRWNNRQDKFRRQTLPSSAQNFSIGDEWK